MPTAAAATIKTIRAIQPLKMDRFSELRFSSFMKPS
jgi:hypothetical protein